MRLPPLVLVLLLVACETAFQPLPSRMGGELFQITTRSGSAIADDEYNVVYRAIVTSVGASRDDLVVSIGVGSTGLTVTAVAIRGVKASIFSPHLRESIASEATRMWNQRELAGRTVYVLEERDASAVVMWNDESTVYIVDAQSMGSVAPILTDLSR